MEKVTILSTHKDAHGDKFTKIELIKFAESLNNDKRKMGINIEHDLTIPPLGRSLNAEVRQGNDEEFYLLMENQYYDEKKIIQLDNGQILIKESFSGKQYPFRLSRFEEENKEIRISVDYNNFETKKDAQNFFDGLSKETSIEFEKGSLIRKSHLPDPMLIIEMSTELVIYLFTAKLLYKIFEKSAEKIGEKIGNKIGNKIGDDVIKFYDLTKKAAKKIIKYSRPKNRPILYVFEINGEVRLELVIKMENTDEVIKSLARDKLDVIEETTINLCEKFNPEKIQFVYDKEKGWKFNFLLTGKGETIGTPLAHERSNKAYKKLVLEKRGDLSIDGKVKKNKT